jgi:tetratricopeptide (TPR) repeat protein
MIRRKTRNRIIAAAAFLAVLVGAGFATHNVEAYNQRPYIYDNLYLPSGRFMEQVSLGFQQIVADVIWFQAVQYYGGYRKDYHDLAYFEGLIDLVTDLDPHFEFPYVFGAVVLSQDMGAYEKAIDLLRKGMVHNPTTWRYPFEIGFLSFIDAHDNELAAHYFDLSSRLPDAPALSKRFAAFVYSRAGHTETSLQMWRELKENTEDPFMRDLAERYIQKLEQGATRQRGRR